MHRKLITAVLMGAALSFRMADDAPAAETPADPTPPAPVPAASPVTVEVPAEHADLLYRAIALLQRGEQTIKDNIEAGIATLEKWYADATKGDDPTA